jgi:DeoR/GlpR family transcriptional regulator of sugar metabolism
MGKQVAMHRRRFILERIKTDGRLPQSTIFDQFPGTNRQSVHDDIEFFNLLGIPIEGTRDGRETVYVDASASHTSVKQNRTGLHEREKRRVALATMGLIVGFPSADEKSEAPLAKRVSADFRECPTKRTITDAFKAKTGPSAHKSAEIIAWLTEFWKEPHRSIVIDAGTTNDRLVELLRTFSLPSPFCSLAQLHVCTNSREMFYVLGAPKVDAKAVMIGGEQVGFTEAVAGKMSEAWISQMYSLIFGVAVIGATMVDMENFHVCSDSHDEASLKVLLYSRSSLKLVCVDASKFVVRPTRAAFPFASVHPQQIDLIVTNRPSDSESRKNFEETVKKIELRGVPVLISNPSSD